jgi:hypothetical protein
MDDRTLLEIRKLVALMRENGVLQLKQGDLELTLHPSALQLEVPEIEVEDTSTRTGTHYTNDYDDPMLYPDGVDPIADRNDRLKTLIGLNQ